jgi:hypothetical protein
MFTPFALDLVTGHVADHASWVDPVNPSTSVYLLGRAITEVSKRKVSLVSISMDRLDTDGMVDVNLEMGSSRKYHFAISCMMALDEAAEAAVKSFRS